NLQVKEGARVREDVERLRRDDRERRRGEDVGQRPPTAWLLRERGHVAPDERGQGGAAPTEKEGERARRDGMGRVAHGKRANLGGPEREQETCDSRHHAKSGRERPAPHEAQSHRRAHGSTLLVPSASRVSMTKRCPMKHRTTSAPPT